MSSASADEADRDGQHERARLELLYKVATAGAHLEVDATASSLADAMVPVVADWGLVVLLDSGGAIEELRVSRSPDPALDPALERMLQAYPIGLDADSGIGLALRRGDRVIYEDIGDDLLAKVAIDDEHVRLLTSLELGAAVIEPLTVRGRRVGALAGINRRGRPLTGRDLVLIGEVASHAAPLLANARLHRDLVASDRALRISEAILRAQGESGVEGLLVVSPEGELLSFNSRFAEMWGFSDEVLATRSDEEALADATTRVVDPEGFIAEVEATYANPVAPRRDEIHFLDGRVLDRYGAPLRLDDDTYLGWAWYFRDITAERRAQEALMESGERFASLARTLQESLLPPDLPDIVGAEVAARFHPAGDGSQIGGDFYDVFQTSETEWCAVMGDVCGKGALAARLTALVRYTARATATRTPSVVHNLEVLNTALLRQSEQDRRRGEHRFATASLVRFRRTEGGLDVRAGCGGHPPPLLLRADGTVEALPCRGSLLGMFDQVRFEPAELSLQVGETLVLYTDGVTEARRGKEEFGEERLVQLLTRHAGSSAASVAGAVEQEVLAFQDGLARDDIAVLAIQAVAAGDD